VKKYSLLFVILAFFYSLAVILGLTTRSTFYLINFIIIGSCVGLGMGLWPVFPRGKKRIARLISQVTVGGYLFFGLGFGLIYLLFGYIQPENMQLEGFWLWLFSGVFQAAVLHYMVAKIAGPLLFNRGWCGWACWTAAVLDLLPWKRSPGRRSTRLGNLRYLHFGTSLLLMIILFSVFKVTLRDHVGIIPVKAGFPATDLSYRSLFEIPEFLWFISGNVLYYVSGILLAAFLKDNRAFCKYLCPITTFLKIGARFSLTKVKQVADGCTLCMACEKNCPMDIQITEYTQKGQRVGSTECIICQTCISTCPQKVLGISFGLDMGRGERLNRMNSGTAE
jgi:ferredoxin-type protein NapH